uniref:Uncharacterized protein n=1 Tax=Clytia hemisphaerica TaxID=252671 RepID=A0A7M5UDA8_9CNID
MRGSSTKEVEVHEAENGVILLQTYQLFFQLEIWSTNDNAGNNDNGFYEPYGQIYLKIGDFSVNQDVDMWNIARANHLYITNGESYFVNRTLSFMEFSDFDQIGNITVHGQVWEYDPSSADDNIGKPDGDLYQAKYILNQDVERRYYGKSTDSYYIRIKMSLSKLPMKN